ncbi:unnamed protein product [Cyclocybe aegerita]|uniref:Uncharacterized protein n=1 Tax=Cyclocybe aegerita TaxID=1973307 RepID=A0A8S0WTF0_CYCAE|nr:unnamed protein product [Cyclocybe aegerita]
MSPEGQSKSYARYANLVQSSGTGKSRMNDELAKKILYIPINLSVIGRGFPPQDLDVRIWLTTETKTRDECAQRCQAFLYGALKQTKMHLELFGPVLGESVGVHARLAHFASIFRERMSTGMSFSRHGEYHRAFYDKVLEDANAFLSAISVHKKKSSSPPTSQHDDATESEGAPKIHRFIPEPKLEPSHRISFLTLEYFPPIFEVGFDALAKPVHPDGSCTIDKLASLDHITHLGRPLFGSRYDKGDQTVKRQIIRFAQEKLLDGPVPTRGIGRLKAEQELACLAVRLNLKFKVTTWREMECAQVKRHMRLCLYASPGFQSMETISPSEPLLAEAAYGIMKDLRLNVAETLSEHLKYSSLEPGLRGELVAELLLLLARDKACSQNTPGPSPMSDGSQRVSDKPLEDAFNDCYIWFNHFVKVEDHDVINQQYLWRLLSRGAAVVCAVNQAGVDIVVPFLRGKALLEKKVSAILIQVQNGVRFASKIQPSIFASMNPFSVGLFSIDVKNPPPVIRMVFALASRSSAITCPRRPDDDSEFDEFTSYDIWCAGALSETFGVIAQDQEKTFAELLDLSRITRRAFLMEPTLDPEVEALRVREEDGARNVWREGVL